MRIMTSSMAAIGLAVFALAAGPTNSASGQEPPVYGRQLMTEQERLEFQERMRAATSQEEREQLRLEHHTRMQERAKEMGVTLPDEPPATGMGRGTGQGMGPGQGVGRGQGMGPGQGMGAGQGGMMRQGSGQGGRGG